MEEVYVPDTSVIIEGVVSRMIENGEIKNKVVILMAVVAELEHQANYGKETGFIGLEEIKSIRKLCKKNGIELQFSGDRPNTRQTKNARSGEIDAMIRDFAWQQDAILITGDKVQHITAEALGVRTKFVDIVREEKPFRLEKLFDKKTMSVHLKEDVVPKAKKGVPGNWEFVPIGKKALDNEEMKGLFREIIEKAEMSENGWIEIERRGSVIVQIGKYRIVMCRPPLSDGIEITAVKPLVELNLEDYNLDPKLIERLEKGAEGILIAGAPGAGKTTFARSLALDYLKGNKIIKTIEAPRDLQLPDEITQYSKNIGSPDELHDILLLSRPDYTIFDEMRNPSDFRLYSDLRLSGVGMAGVIHGTSAIDTVQRFIGKIELGMITSIIDTVIFIDSGKVGKVYELKMTVKMPTGMTEADLARPVIEIKDFLTQKLEYEIYTFGEETVVVPINPEIKRTSDKKDDLAKRTIERQIRKYIGKADLEIDMPSQNRSVVYVEESAIPRLIGKEGKIISDVEDNLGIKIDVRSFGDREIKEKEEIKFKMKKSGGNLIFTFARSLSENQVDFYVGEDFLFSATVGKKGEIRFDKGSELAKTIQNSIDKGKTLYARV
jgi:ATPase